MSLKEEINKAIGCHGLWKGRLSTAIDTGASEFAPEKICHDNECDFGKWLQSPALTAADKTGPHFETVHKHHADFHRVAADVLRLALAGQKAEAHKLIAPGSRFASVSGELTASMMAWMRSVK
jgi:hypothetical protein